MEKRKFKAGDVVVALFRGVETKGIVISISADEARPPYLISFGSDAIWYNENELKPYEPSNEPSEQKEEFKKHKGCEFVNDDFYRAFTRKNGQIIFNKVKVSTVCICKDDDDIDSVIIAKIDSDKRLEPNIKVRLSDGSDGTVLKSIKIMDKYLDDLVQSLAVANVGIVDSVLDIVGIYKEQEVTKTELVLEEI